MKKSKQLSIISKRLKLLDFTFFIDRQIDGDDLLKLLTDAEMKIERHRTHFAPEVDDDVWIPKAAKAGWVIITADKAIKKDHLDAVCDSKAQVIMLTDNISGYAQWGAAIISGMPVILNSLLAKGRPLILRLSLRGRITSALESSEIESQRREIETKSVVREKMGR